MMSKGKKHRGLVLFLAASVLAGSLLGIQAADSVWERPSDELESLKPLERLLEEDGFVYGILVPWFEHTSYGVDIGRNYRSNYSATHFNENKVREIFTNCKAMGFNMVKLWLSEIMEGIVFDDEGHVLGVDEVYLQNLETIFNIAEELDVNLALTMVSHLSQNAQTRREYDVMTRFIFNADVTDQYIEKWVEPVLGLAKQYDNIMLIDLYAEPEGDINDRNCWWLDRGTTWKRMEEFLLTLGAACRRINPDWMITVSSGGSYNNVSKMNEWGLDFIGADIYNDTGELKDPAELNLSAPFMLGEFGPATKNNWSDTFQTDLSKNFFENAVELGYAGAFFWIYGFVGSTEALTLVNSSGDLRQAAAYFRQSALDRAYAKTGYSGMDRPATMYITDTDAVKFFGSRGADSYMVERSKDKTTWTTVAEFSAEGSDYEYVPGLFKLSDAEAETGAYYYYRVTAVGDGERLVSEISNPVYKKKITCSAEENLVKDYSFESGTFAASPTEGWYCGTMSDVSISSSVALAGEKSLHFESQTTWESVQQIVEVKPHTNYTVTFYCKSEDTRPIFSLNFDWTTIGKKLIPLGDNEWHAYTLDFNSGEHTSVRFYLPSSGGNYYFDTIYLFETPADTPA